ncbi:MULTISPECIES: hypothetical protein [Agrobacterium tumefaciens complex]|uniref:hypothetical protein n=1 Tax=Agrobacterium tumefaciens complex TaxID=1183400 RepID=UPI000F90B875|nr:hypothetical protein [Agrobacterium radiobacter]MBB4407069.1 hypothetical protein [Agrobacterium radiobacter]MBB4452727.1 hypothetical protein [Agrobacterium radiobacter]UXR93883.1 hypothetical protein FY157_19605 [Agrobacterium tumefaciens]
MKTAPTLHPSIVKASLAAKAAEMEVQAAAEYLADAMARIHGGKWKIDIAHEHHFVMIFNRARDNDPIKPKEGGVV